MIRKVCKCGEIYKFKDSMAGEEVYCPKCDNKIKIETGEKYFNIFSRDLFFINQKHFSFAEEYYILGENEEELLYAVRGKKFLRLILGVIIGIAVSSIIIGILMSLLTDDAGEILLGASGFIIIILTILIAGVIYGKRNVYFYEDDKKYKSILKIEQENLFHFIKGKYRVLDENDIVIAKLEKNYIYNLIRKRWYWKDVENKLVAVIKEESLLLALLRKITGSLFGILRSNFIFQTNQGEIFGEFNRKITFRDKYVLDLTSDCDRIYNRKVCIAMGILLDTGEKR